MTFLPGQSGNPHGRPKKPDFYAHVKDEFFNKNLKSHNKILNSLRKGALAGDKWCVREWLSLFVPKATMNIATTSTELSEKRVIVQDALSNLSYEEKQALYDLLTKKQSEPVTIEAEVIEES